LEQDSVCFYRVVESQTGAPLSRVGRFRTAPVSPRPFTFAWSADMDEAYKPFRLFDAIGAKNPEFFLHLGDTIYADLPRKEFYPSIPHYRRKHANNRRDPHLQQFLLRHSTYAIWDDHETDNNCHGGHPNMAEGLQVFREYWPCLPAGSDGLYRRFTWAGVDFLILDTRRFRSPHAEQEGPAKSMLGTVQKQWLLDALESSRSPFKFIVTSVPFQGGGEDTWGNYKTERSEIASFIRERKIGGVVFLTGDYHLARDWTNPKAGFREYMAGPIASFVHYRHNPAARDRYEKAATFHYGDGYNFGLVRVDPTTGKAAIEFIDADGKTLHALEFTA
jgi:alkaline phosphatase D